MPTRPTDGPSSQPDEDLELLERIRGGQLDLFHELMRRHEAAIFRGAMAILGNAADAEDVVQETFLRAFRNLNRFRGEAKFRTWLIQIAVNAARSRLREIRKERWQPLDAADGGPAVSHRWEPAEPTANPEEAYSWKELGRVFRTILDGLHPQYRSVLYMRDVDDLSTGATAIALGITEESVRTRLRRARAHLRSRVQQRLAKGR
ncbi:MAG TPA: sigma-70 family RNA polymerase sigma factor [Candidatus Saccharimonadales bacterium]|nr:sigma-70 family RNA polymerase sigma factor [Candidatus Saccharimonadales bacterium]